MKKIIFAIAGMLFLSISYAQVKDTARSFGKDSSMRHARQYRNQPKNKVHSNIMNDRTNSTMQQRQSKNWQKGQTRDTSMNRNLGKNMNYNRHNWDSSGNKMHMDDKVHYKNMSDSARKRNHYNNIRRNTPKMDSLR